MVIRKGSDNEYALLDRLIEENLYKELTEFVATQTYRDDSVPESAVVANLQKLHDVLMAQAAEFNKGQKTHKLMPIEWKHPTKNQQSGPAEYWLFGLRLGAEQKEAYKIALISHLDTVPPGSNPHWEPFKLKVERRNYQGRLAQQFYVGRGSIDDKGPAIVALNVLKAVARRYDGSPKLDKVAVLLLLDTSEETDMAFPHYLNANPAQNPNFGLIYDASWCVRAEKGIERPVFTIKRGTPVTKGMWIVSLNTPQGPANQIPDTATATICSDSDDQLTAFAQVVKERYEKYLFDDPKYRRARMTVDTSHLPRVLMLVTSVAGAQHGSAAYENREEGANPLVSLANFLSGLVQQGKLASNEVGRMCEFIVWAWGTRVFGEYHPALLARHDKVFTESNGTTYALTRFHTNPTPDTAVRLELDIRYAIGHHSSPWDEKTEGFLPGENSIFERRVFPQLLAQFNIGSPYQVAVSTKTIDPPDLRLPSGETFSKVNRAYEEVMRESCPARAIGGGTDAKGHTHLIAAGALFTEKMGPPINFHGFNEGAPVNDLTKGARILYRLLVDEIETAGS